MLHPQQKITPSASYRLNSLEALRGVAAVFVVMVHASHTLGNPKDYGFEPFGGLFDFGRSGLDFFFVLSGFIIMYVHVGDIGRPTALARFCFKRLLRIYPAYWIVTLLFGGLLAVSPTPDQSERELAHALSSFFLWPEMAEPILGVGWSLRHELMFYAFFAVAILNRQAGIVVFATWFLGIAWNVAVQLSTGQPYFEGLPGLLLYRGFNLEFLFGILAAILVRREIIWFPATLAGSGAALFMAMGVWEALGTPVMHEWPVRHIAYATGAAAVLWGLAILDRQGRTKVPALGYRLGTASYSIYLTNIPVLLIVEFGLRGIRHVVPVPIELAFAGLVIAATLAGTVFSQLVEQPLLGLGRKALASKTRLQPRLQPP